VSQLTNDELLLLDNLIYTKYVKNGRTIAEIIELAEKDIEAGKFKTSCEMTEDEWKQIFNMVKGNEKLSSYTVTNYVDDSNTGMRAACFVDDTSNPSDVNVVFRGTSGDYEWHDNGQGGYLPDTEQQKRAAEYVENLPKNYGDDMTVTGHSKGGNKAQYVTITTDRINRCVSYDGQGFSQEFIDKYQVEINEKSKYITSISAENDFVNCLLIPIAGERLYVITDEQSSFKYNHKPNILLNEDGSIREYGEQSGLSKFINEYTTYLIDEMEEPERSYTIDGVIALLEEGEGKEGGFQTAVSIINAGGHLDDFAFDYIGDHYGVIAELGLTYIAAVTVPVVFADDLINAIKETSVEVYNRIATCVENIYNKLNEFGDKAKKFATEFSNKAKQFITDAKGWVQEKVSAIGDFFGGLIDGWFGKQGHSSGRGFSRASLIQISPENLKNHANKMRKYKRDQENYMNKIRRIVNDLDGNWKGDAQKAFVAKFQSMESVYKQFGDVLEQYADLADKAANEMQTVDNNIKRQLRSV